MAPEAHKLTVLALEPYYGGSHRAFLDTWIAHSRHDWRLITLPARHWKWRMRGSAIWFSQQVRRQGGSPPDVMFTCDLTAVADLRALLPAGHATAPLVCYFHENQLTYPLAPDDWRDYQYAFTNITSALATDALWFNSRAHLTAFTAAVRELFAQMPDFVPERVAEAITGRAQVHHPAVDVTPPAGAARRGLRGKRLRILWCHRWEFDKDPETFFDVISRLADAGADFELVLVGEQFRAAPAVFAEAQRKFASRIVHAGYLPDRAAYSAMLETCDVVVSTAIQENFGIAVVEAILSGCLPLLPNRLSYPEIIPNEFHAACIYANPQALFDRLMRAASGDTGLDATQHAKLMATIAERFAAVAQVARLDDALSRAVKSRQAR